MGYCDHRNAEEYEIFVFSTEFESFLLALRGARGVKTGKVDFYRGLLLKSCETKGYQYYRARSSLVSTSDFLSWLRVPASCVTSPSFGESWFVDNTRKEWSGVFFWYSSR